MKMRPFIDESEIRSIHDATLRVLNDVGIMIDDPEAKAILLESGATEAGGMVKLPPGLVESCLQQCPRQVLLQGRSNDILLGDGTLHVHNLGGARDVYSPETLGLKPATRIDVAESARLLDAMDNVTTITPLYTPQDVPPEKLTLFMFADTVRNTTKPINGPGVHNVQDVKLLVEMMKIIFGDAPSISIGVSPVSPLNFLGHVAPVLIQVAREGVPLGPLPCPNVGATSPMSLAGSLVLQNAEVLASIVIAELCAPGLPIVYCGRLSVLNMRSGVPIWGNPELGIMSAAAVQLGHFYNLPVNVYGLAGSGFAPDMQSGYERAINALVPALIGADELSGVGEMAGGVYSCNAQIVIDDDIYGMVRRVIRGFVVDEDSLAVDVIAHAMSSSRNFLSEKHTRKYLRSGEIWEGRIGIQESGWESWNKAGNPSVLDRAQNEAKKILATHEVLPLTEEQDRAINELLNA